jgi:hypothetical protein
MRDVEAVAPVVQLDVEGILRPKKVSVSRSPAALSLFCDHA